MSSRRSQRGEVYRLSCTDVSALREIVARRQPTLQMGLENLLINQGTDGDREALLEVLDDELDLGIINSSVTPYGEFLEHLLDAFALDENFPLSVEPDTAG